MSYQKLHFLEKYSIKEINTSTGNPIAQLYRVSQEERSIFWEVIVSAILSKNVYMNMCPIPNGFRDSYLNVQPQNC